MCGRFSLFADDEVLASLFDVDFTEGGHPASYNQAPSQMIRAVVENPRRILTLQQWGLVPSWAKPGFKPLINARAETLTEKPSFRAAAKRRRCLLPANGYFEWEKGQPYFLSRSGDPVLAMAGIYEVTDGDESAPFSTAAIVTRAATDALGHIHSRMPLFVPRESWDAWLANDITEKGQVDELIRSFGTPELNVRPVSKAVGNVSVTDAEAIFGSEYSHDA
jgi:Uncharacterized conserved protein